MSSEIKPSEEGKKRYPPDGYYYIDDSWKEPCVCSETCQPDCIGNKCNCFACRTCYADFLGGE